MPGIIIIIRGLTAANSNAFILKTKSFCGYFNAFLQSLQNCEHFEKKVEPYSLSISKIIYWEKHGYANAYRSCFRTSFGSQGVNGSLTLQNSAKVHFYPTLSSLWAKQMSKTSFLVIFEIVGLYVKQISNVRRSKVLSPQYGELSAANSNACLLKTRNIL